jgi:hypothetical protein
MRPFAKTGAHGLDRDFAGRRRDQRASTQECVFGAQSTEGSVIYSAPQRFGRSPARLKLRITLGDWAGRRSARKICLVLDGLALIKYRLPRNTELFDL